MKKDKHEKIQKSGKKETSIVRSSAAEYLTFVAAGGNSETSVEMRYEDENIWLTQKMMAALYDVSVSAINQHLKRVFADNELEESAVIKKYLITAADGKNYNTKHYSLQAIIGKPRPPLAIPVSCLGKQAVAICDQIRAVDKSRLVKKTGNISREDLRQLEDGLKKILMLSD